MNIDMIQPEEVYQMQENHKDCILIDVREDDEVAHAAPPGSHHFPMSQFDPQKLLNSLNLDPSSSQTCLCFICRSGARSLRAAKLCHAAGYENVRNVEGGMIRWQEYQLPVRHSS